MAAILRALLLALVALGIWFLDSYTGEPHHVADVSAPSAAFSAARADGTLARLLGPEKPHPVSSAENAAVRGRILKEFAALGMQARTYQAFTCNPGRKFGFVICATVTDVVAEVVPGSGKAIVMMAHYDSVPAGPGASDDESGVATVLETARALRVNGGTSLHPVIALITDGEEADLLGANAFLQNASLKGLVGAVVNVEARGTNGPSLLFQTSPGDGKLIDLYAAHVTDLATSSLYAEIYKFLPNDTDLTLFIRDGFPSYNFAFTGNVRYYHSPFDLRRNLSLATLQMHGENLLGVVTGLEQTSYADLKGGNDIYLTVFGRFLPRMPESWALPFAIVVFVLLLLATWLSPDDADEKRSPIVAALMPPALMIGCGLLGLVLALIAKFLSDHPDPTYAHPLDMRLALGAGVFAATLLVSRMTDVKGSAASAWLWMAGLGVVVAAFLPGISPYFVFPAAVAAVLLLATTQAPGGWSGAWGQIALLLSSLAALVVWIGLVATGESLMGLSLHPLFTIPAALGLVTVVPLLAADPMERAAWRAVTAVAFLLAIVGAVAAGFQRPYSAASPQRVDLIYFENEKGDTRWIASTSWKATGTDPIPASLVDAGHLKLTQDAYPGLDLGSAYTAPAGKPRYALPIPTVVSNQTIGGNHVTTVELRSLDDADGMMLYVPKAAKLLAVDVRRQYVPVPKDWSDNLRILCLSRDCRDLTVTLTYSGSLAGTEFAEERCAFPPFGTFLKAARPNDAMASQSGDQIILADAVKLR